VANESGITDTADPLAGSYFVESLTNELEQKALALINQIDEMGGAVSSIENGFMQNKIAESAYAYQKAIESKEKIIVGVNQFESTSTTNIPVFQIDESIRIQQIEKLKALKSSRDNTKVLTCLAAVKNAAAGTDNLMPSVIDAIENYCTLGEIADVLRGIYGEYQA
jgi:methylmalonyl-CoA mutase N-terminal domain/subunit